MEDWTKKTDDEVFSSVGEQPGSQAAYWRDIEIRRRHFVIAEKVANVQIKAAEAQKDAADAASDTAVWTKRSAIFIAASVLVLAIASVADLLGR